MCTQNMTQFNFFIAYTHTRFDYLVPYLRAESPTPPLVCIHNVQNVMLPGALTVFHHDDEAQNCQSESVSEAETYAR